MNKSFSSKSGILKRCQICKGNRLIIASILFLLLGFLVSCKKGDEDTTNTDPVVDEPILTGHNVWGHEFSFDSAVGLTHGNSKEFDVNQDGINDIRFTDEPIHPNNSGAYNGWQYQQKFDVTILNPKLSLAVSSQKTSYRVPTNNGYNTFTTVTDDKPSLANLDFHTSMVDNKLDYSSKTTNSLLYIGYFANGLGILNSYDTNLCPPWPQDNTGKNFVYTQAYMPGIYSYPTGTLTPSAEGYIGFKLMDSNNQPVYGWIEVNIFDHEYTQQSFSLSYARWYQITFNIYQIAIGNKPGKPIQPGCGYYEGCKV
jgi:hypothetical protein